MTAATTCAHCGEDLYSEILDIYSDRTFYLATCCQGLLDEAADWLTNGTRQDQVALMTLLGYPDLVGYGVRRVYDSDGEGLKVDNGLRLVPIRQRDAKDFVRAHHRHNKPPAGWRYGLAVANGWDLVAVAMIGRPVARALDHTQVVEVNRLCVDPTLDPQLAWNACSMLYGEAAREAKRRGFQKIITYTLESEAGTGLKACGWDPAHVTAGGSWNTPSRPRKDTAPTCPKVRWEKELNPRRRKVA